MSHNRRFFNLNIETTTLNFDIIGVLVTFQVNHYAKTLLMDAECFNHSGPAPINCKGNILTTSLKIRFKTNGTIHVN